MMARRVHSVALLLCTLAGVVSCEGCNISALSEHVEQLLAEYDRDVEPARPVDVRLVLDLRHASLHDDDAELHVLADLRMSWQEPRITWNVSEWGCEWALCDAEWLWVPDVTCMSAQASEAAASSARVRLSAGGAALRVSRLLLRAPLELDLADWPRDTHQATLLFASLMHTTDEMTLNIDDHKFVTLYEKSKWKVVSVVVSDLQAPDTGFPRAALAWRVTVQRQSPAHAAAAGAALAAALIIMLAATLLTPPDRPPLYAAAAVTTVLWTSSALPLVGGAGGAVPARLRAACTAGGGAALLCAGAALSSWLARRSVPPADKLRNLILNLTSLLKLSPLQVAEGSEAVAAWAAAARLLDLLMLLLLLTILLVCLTLSL